MVMRTSMASRAKFKGLHLLVRVGFREKLYPIHQIVWWARYQGHSPEAHWRMGMTQGSNVGILDSDPILGVTGSNRCPARLAPLKELGATRPC